MEIGYRHRETKEITVINAEVTPRKQYNAREYEKLYEVASVKVILG